MTEHADTEQNPTPHDAMANYLHQGEPRMHVGDDARLHDGWPYPVPGEEERGLFAEEQQWLIDVCRRELAQDHPIEIRMRLLDLIGQASRARAQILRP